VKRLLLTLLVPAGVLLVDRLPLPGVHPEVLGPYIRDAGPILSLFNLGLNPAISAALAVEVAALVVRRWRPLRHAGPEGRARLAFAALVVTIVLASVQAFSIDRWMLRSSWQLPFGMSPLPETAAGRLVVLASIVTGAVILVGIARGLTRHGLGGGFSILIAALAIPKIAHDLDASLGSRAFYDGEIRRALTLPALGVLALAFATASRRAGVAGAARRTALPAPSSTILPFSIAIALVSLRPQLRTFGVELPALWSDPRVQALVLVALTIALAWLFARPALLVPLWRRAGVVADTDAPSSARALFRRGAVVSVVYVIALGALFFEGSRARVVLDVAGALTVLCVMLDVAGEWQFRRAHAEVVGVWPEHRLYAVEPALARLDEAGIAAFPRGLRHRALLGFIGPYVPVELLVPVERAEEARALLETVLGAEPR
jgi:hypothetical protein